MAKKAPITPEQKVEAGKALLAEYDLDDSTTTSTTSPEPAEVIDEAIPEPVVEKPKIPAWVSSLAREAGMSESDTDGMTAEEVKEAVALKSRINRDIESSRGQHRQLNSAGRPYDPTTGKLLPVDRAPETEPADSPFNLKELGIDTTKFGDDATTEQILTAALKPLHDRNKSLEARIAHLEQHNQHRAAKDAGDKLDTLFDSNQTVFGKGNRDKMNPTSPEFMRRKMVIAAMKSNYESDRNLSFEDNFEMASKAFSSLIPAAPKTEKPEEIPDDHGYRNGATRPPTNRTAPNAKRSDKTATAAVGLAREMDRFVNGREEDDLPDHIV